MQGKLASFIQQSVELISLQDAVLPVGTLRYGNTVASELGETVEWRHW